MPRKLPSLRDRSRPPRRVPLPRSTYRAVKRHGSEANAGLIFCKYVKLPQRDFDQQAQAELLKDAAQTAHLSWQRLAWERIIERHRQLLRDTGAAVFTARTNTPLALHLSQALPMENAGLALHPVWGVPYIPGTAVKGLTRHYAEHVWLPQQSDQLAARECIDRIFGTAPSDGTEGASSRGGRAGTVVFFEAWPTDLRQIRIDIVNPHHRSYYMSAGGIPPADWDQPQPVYFPTVPAGTEFLFGLAPRTADAQDDVALAMEWLQAALVHDGLGAKTAAGYGRFTVPSSVPALASSPKRTVAEYELVLQTPGFFGGADPANEEGAELRVASLRGLLRWWWRTIHAGNVTTRQLYDLEAAIWGKAEHSSAVVLRLEPLEVPDAEMFDRRALIEQRGLTGPLPRGDAGLAYISYGMSQGRTRRWYIPPGARWRLIMWARPVTYTPSPQVGKGQAARQVARPWEFSAEEVLEQAELALWLLCHFGGVGSKARKGFGSFATPQTLAKYTLEEVRKRARSWRRRCGLKDFYDDRRAVSPSFSAALERQPRLDPLELTLSASDAWEALNQVGNRLWLALRSFSSEERKAFGLPRRTRSSGPGLFHVGEKAKKRHAAPYWFHLEQQDSAYIWRAVFFPSDQLPSVAGSREILAKFRDLLKGQAEEGEATT